MQLRGLLQESLKQRRGTTKSGKDWSKKSFVVTTEDKYPKEVCFTLFGEKVELLKKSPVGGNVTVHFNLSSREYNGKYYHNIDAWKIDSESATTTESEWKSTGRNFRFTFLIII